MKKFASCEFNTRRGLTLFTPKYTKMKTKESNEMNEANETNEAKETNDTKKTKLLLHQWRAPQGARPSRSNLVKNPGI